MRVTADAAVRVIGRNRVEALLLRRCPEAASGRLRLNRAGGVGARGSVEADRDGWFGEAEEFGQSAG
ncbi:MAG TPA: hypothetical protein VLL82_12625 [Mycobacterium sp.]|nr:hypothetical protein [Mycobacterium sp.]